MLAAFVFHNVSNGKQKLFAIGSRLKHCTVICYKKDNTCAAFEYSEKGIKFKVLKAKNFRSLVDHVFNMQTVEAVVCVEVFKRKIITWKPWIVRSCNEICRYVTSVNVGLTLTPAHLYKRLLKKNGSNYQILVNRRKHVHK